MNLSADATRALAVVLAGVAILAAAWTMAISPKREDSAAARDRADVEQQKLDSARAELAKNTKARASFDDNRRELRRLDTAVPVRGDIAKLLRSLQKEAGRRGASLRIAALTPGTAAAGATGTTTESSVVGASEGPNGLSKLSFNLQYTGDYFALVHILRTVRRAVVEREGKVTAKGRLLTIDGLNFKPTSDDKDKASGIVDATINATAYIAPDPAAKAPAADPAAATPGAAGADGTVPSSTSASASQTAAVPNP